MRLSVGINHTTVFREMVAKLLATRHNLPMPARRKLRMHIKLTLPGRLTCHAQRGLGLKPVRIAPSEALKFMHASARRLANPLVQKVDP